MLKELSRRYLQGRISDNIIWQNKIESICMKWLIKTPTLSASDDWVKHRRKSIQVWQTGALVQALCETGNEALIKKATQRIHRDFNCDIICDSDYGLLCFALRNQSEFEVLRSTMLRYILDNQTDEHLVYYKSGVKSSAFVDTLGFVCPFLTEYGLSNNRPDLVELAKKQIELYFENGIEPHSGLPFHAYEIDRLIPRGICDWARGLAWLLIALMDSYLCLQKVGKTDSFYEKNILRYGDLLLTLQKNSGAYSWQLLSGQESDSSATAVFGWYLAHCYELFGNSEHLYAARKCREYLKSVTFNNGVIDYCQGDTISIGVYSRSFDKMPFAQGFALRMQARLKRYDS